MAEPYLRTGVPVDFSADTSLISIRAKVIIKDDIATKPINIDFCFMKGDFTKLHVEKFKDHTQIDYKFKNRKHVLWKT